MSTSKKHYRIYIKSTRQWVDVSKEVYRDHMHHCDATRKRMQYHGRCVCPKKQFWLCDADCLTCEFQRSGDTASLNQEFSSERDDSFTVLDTLVDPTPSIDDVIASRDEISQLLNYLAEIMPEAITVGIMREQGMSESAIAARLGIPRTTLRSRLCKAREQLKAEFPNLL